MPERSDEDLMMAYASGDMAAFEQLYRRHRGPLYRFLLRQTRDPVTANDLYQGCWEKVIRARPKYRPTAPFPAWLYRIARNHLLDHYRLQRPTAPIEPENLVATDAGPDQILAESQAQAGLVSAVEALPPDQREALLLRLEAGLDLATIAEVTGVKAETAKSRLRYAVKRTREALAMAGSRTES